MIRPMMFVCIFNILIALLLCPYITNGEEVYRVTTPQEYVGLLNMCASRYGTGVRFRCEDYDSEFPVIEVHTPYSKSGLKMYKEKTREMMAELSFNWFRLTGSSTVYVFDAGKSLEDLGDDSVVFILEKGDLIEPGTLI